MTSSSEIISKGELSAYQRWELASLAEAHDDRTEGDRAQDRNALSERESAAAAERTQQEGFAAGYAAGIAQAEATRARLGALVASLGEDAGSHRQKLLDELLDFSLLLARQMVGEALAVRRELVLPVVSAALKLLPQMSQSVQLLLNPADLDLVRTFLAGDPTTARCAVLADASIAPGGCRVVTEQCDVDASVPTRWRRLLANLGCSDEWLESV